MTAGTLNSKAAITGIGELRPAKFPAKFMEGASVPSLMLEVARKAMLDAEMEPAEVDGLLVVPPLGGAPLIFPAMMTEYLGLTPNYLDVVDTGGASGASQDWRAAAQEAWRIGLVNEVVPAEDVVGRAKEYGAMIAANAPLAVSACTEAVIRSSGVTLEEAYRIESEVSAKVMRSEDAREGPRAFMEKRPPVFTGH